MPIRRRRLTWCEKYNIVINVTVYHVTEKYSNIRPSEVDYILKKKKLDVASWRLARVMSDKRYHGMQVCVGKHQLY